MTADQTSTTTPVTASEIESALIRHLEERVKTTVAPDHDIFASGLASSMFAMELVVHLEQSYGISIVGPDLKLDNFRTARSMTGLVLRLRADQSGDV
ncbi:acyl carrier protein [Nocardia sp. CA-129566]|uniref:acyl carrier protein n=1 Tax=Nocardia sp. CA-129566 TaxID=3239976 RepID=UPI003D98118C